MQEHRDVDMRLNVPVPMHDEVNLSADLYLPRAAGPFPTVLIRTPYSNNIPDMIRKGRALANRGYACVIQDVRGRWDSEGEYYPFLNEARDGYDTLEWVGHQPWCDGKIGMSGASYQAAVQWMSAPLQSEFLTCIVPRVMCNDYFADLIFPGGAMQLNVAITWGMRTRARTSQSIDFHNWTELFRTLPLADLADKVGEDVPFWQDWINHPTDDDYWQPLKLTNRFDEVTVPVLEMSGWYDLYGHRSFNHFNRLRQHGGSPASRNPKLIVGPWAHRLGGCTCTGDVDFGVGSMLDLDAIELNWFDCWLKGIDNGAIDDPPLRIFVMGVNKWRDETEWPLARTDWQEWHLHSGGSANTVIGDGVLARSASADEPPDQFIYDPLYPVQTLGGSNCCTPDVVPWGPYDQRPVEMRSDVLCYTAEPFDADVEVIGPIRLILYAATDGLDTDWTAKLVDVSPTGYAMNLCDGIIRARYRDSFTDPSLLDPPQVYEYTIDVGATANVFQTGHRIRVEISSSNFPRFDRNPNTGNPFGKDAELRTAKQTVLHSDEYPSRLILPVIPDG